MEKTLRLFAQLSKVDEAKREVSGLATAEIIDKEGEIFDYESSKPYFKSWTAEIAKATEGKSLGNVREMHQPSAVGKLTSIEFDDAMKTIGVTAKIVDEAAWQKCLQGVYTGFSIGGSYVKVWTEGDEKRYTADPAEVSVVDNPCNPGAHFTAVKADGLIEVRKFAQKDVPHSGTPIAAKGETVKKDMYSVSNMAALLQSLVYLQMDTACEAEYEGDESDIPAELSAWVKSGAAILARMTEEELSELLGTMKSAEAKFGKKGAKFSAKTKAHLAGIQKCVKDTQDHLDALGKDDGMDSAAHIEIEKSSAATPQIQEGESEMLDAKEKAQLDAATEGVASLKAGQDEIAKSLNNIAKVLGKMAGVEEPGAQKVVRTTPPAVSVTKEQDIQAHAASAEEAELTREMTAEEVQKLTPGQREKRYIAMTKDSYSKPKQVFHTPGRGVI